MAISNHFKWSHVAQKIFKLNAGVKKCHSLTLSKQCLRPAPSKCLSERINWIISTIPHRISKILFVYGSYQFLAMLEGKIREAPFFKVQSGKITVWLDNIRSEQGPMLKMTILDQGQYSFQDTNLESLYNLNSILFYKLLSNYFKIS